MLRRLNKPYIIILLLLLGSLVGIIYSSILVYHHLNHDFQVRFCGSDPTSGCNSLNRSIVSEWMGIPISSLGIFYYVFSFFLAILIFLYSNKTKQKLLYLFSLALSLFAMLVDVFFIIYSISQQTICKLCLLTYIATLIIFLASFWGLKRSNENSIKELLKDSLGKYAHLIFHFFCLFLIALFFSLFIWFFSNKSFYKDPFQTFDVAVKQYKQQILSKFQLNVSNINEPINLEVYLDLIDESTLEVYNYLLFLKSSLKDNLNIDWKFYPLDSTCNNSYSITMSAKSCFLSQVAYCSAEFQVQDQLFKFLYQKNNYSIKIKEKSFLEKFTKNVKIPKESFTNCVYSKRIQKHVSLIINTFEKEILKSDTDIYVPRFRLFSEFHHKLPPISFLQELLHSLDLP